MCQWDAQTGEQLTESPGHTKGVTSVSYHPDGSKLASGTINRIVYQWDVRTGKQLTKSLGHTGYVNSVVYHPDGRWLISGSEDRTIRIWDIKLVDPYTIAMITDNSAIHSVAIDAASNLIAGMEDSTIKCWQYNPVGDTPRWVMKWSTNFNKVLFAEGCQLAEAIGLSQNNFRVLSQLGAIGIPRAPIGENPHSFFRPVPEHAINNTLKLSSCCCTVS